MRFVPDLVNDCAVLDRSYFWTGGYPEVRPYDRLRPMATTKPKMGRPQGKHSDPQYAQMTIYVDRTVRNLVKSQLALQDDGEFSGLVEVLLRRWLVKRGVVVPEPKPAGRK